VADRAGESTQTAAFVFRRTRQILTGSGDEAIPEMPAERQAPREGELTDNPF
jgi:hypothetical protein